MPKWIQISIEREGGEPQKPVREPSPEEEAPARRWGLWWLLIPVVIIVAAGVGWSILRGRGGAWKLPAVVATVNGQDITRDDLLREVSLARAMSTLVQKREVASDEAALRQLQVETLNQAVDHLLVFQEASKAGITVNDAEVEQQLVSLQSAAAFTEADLARELGKAGLTRDILKEWLRDRLVANRYVNDQVLQDVPPQEQQDAYKAWFNDLQTASQVDIFLGSSSGGGIAKVGEPGPDFTLATLGGGQVKLGDLKGRPVLINFWATWCGPCRYEMPALEAMYQKYKGQGLVVIGVDVQEPENLVAAFVQQYGLTFPIALDSNGEVASIYRIRAYPTTYFVNPEGVIQDMHRGAMNQEIIEGYLRKIMPES